MSDFTESELQAELQSQLGRDPEYTNTYLRTQGLSPADANVTASDSLNSPANTDALKTAGLVFQENGVRQFLAENGHGNIADSDALKAVDAGLDHVADAKRAKSVVRDWLVDKPLTGIRRGGNVLELVLGGLSPAWNGSQQMFMGWRAGEKRDEMMVRLLGERGRPEDGEHTLFMDSWTQLKRLTTASLSGNWERAALLSDVEPRTFESLRHNLDLGDLLIKRVFNDDARAYEMWRGDLQSSKFGLAKVYGLEVADQLTTFADPLMLAGEIKAAATGTKAIPVMARLAKFSPSGKLAGLRTLDEAKGLQLEADLQKELEPLGRSLGSSLSLQKNAAARLKSAKAAMEADHTNPEVLRQYVTAEKRASEANLAVNRFGQAPVSDIYLQKLPRTNPATIATRGKTIEQLRREVLAAEEAAPGRVNQALGEVGYQGKNAATQFGAAIDGAVAALGAGERTAQHLETLNKWSSLPADVQRALEVKGISVPQVVRKSALMQEGLNPGDWAKLDDLPLFNQRSLLGPDDVEAAGDAAKMLTEGADIGDVSMHNAVLPEYSIVGQGRDVPRGLADGFWVKEVIDSRKQTVNGARVFKDDVQLKLFNDHLPRGLVGTSLAPSRLLARALFPLREPRGALRGTGIFERVNAGQMNYEIGKTGTDEFLERTLKEADIIKKGLRTLGRIQYNGKTGTEGAMRIARALDGDGVDPVEFGVRMDALRPAERTAYFELRKWFDNMADRQGIQGQQRITNYWRHLFPEHLFENGARPPEFVGLPVTAEVNGSHLLPRLGKAGYSMDLLEVLENYNRASHRKIYIEPTLQDAMDLADATGAPHVIKYTQKWVSEMKGLPTFIDSAVDEFGEALAQSLGVNVKLPRPSQVGIAVSNIYYASLIGGNLNYLLQNVGTGILNPLSKFGALHTANGILKMATPEGRAMAKAAGLDTHFSKLFEGDALRAYSDFMTSLGPKQSELYVRGLSMHAALSDIMKRSGKSWTELKAAGLERAALDEAVNAAELVQHVYGVMGRSPMMSRVVGHGTMTFAGQFLSFPFKQTGLLMELGREDPGNVLRYFGYSGIFQRFASDELGIDTSQWTGMGYLPTPRKGQAGPMSPGMTLLASEMDYMAAVQGGDPNEIGLALGRRNDALMAGIPALGPLTRASEAADRIHTGAITNPSTGEFVRPLELPKEILPTILQTRSTAENQFRNVEEQHKQQVHNELFFRKQLSDEYADAIRTGDSAKFVQLQQRLSDMGIHVSPNGNIVEPLFMSRTLREYLQNPNFMPFGFQPSSEDIRAIEENVAPQKP